MAVATRISNVAARAACDAIVDLLDAGDSPAVLQIWSGTQPTNPDVAVTDGAGGYDLLAEITLNDPAFGAAADANPGGRATADVDPALQDASANKSGTAAWFRACSVNSGVKTPVIDGSIGTSAADMIVPTTTVTATQPFAISSWTVTMPETEA
jgi:hypothetical protein